MIYKFIFKVLLFLSPVFAFYGYMRWKYPPNPYKCTLKYGKPGAGKTLDIVRSVLEDLRKGWTPYTNIPMNIPGVRYFDVNDYGKYKFEPHSHVYIDEAGIVWNNRDFKDYKKYQREFTKLYRHYKISLTLYSQANDIDATLRRVTSDEWIMYKVANYFSFQRKLKKNLKILPPEQVQDADAQLVNTLEKEFILFPGSTIIYWQPTYFGYYDTYEIPDGLEDMPFEMMHGQIRHRSTMKALKKQARKERKELKRKGVSAHAQSKKDNKQIRFKLFNRISSRPINGTANK